jgi:uncharacterized protein (DUF1015 family)
MHCQGYVVRESQSRLATPDTFLSAPLHPRRVNFMPRIKPFAALRPHPQTASLVASVPYDVVNREEAAELAKGNPASFLHVVRSDIDFPPGHDPYAPEIYSSAADNLQRLLRENLLTQESSECLYAYRQIMGDHSQIGIVCCAHIDDYENNLILKHEKTRPAKEDDRTRHVIALDANSGPVFLTYRGSTHIDSQVSIAVQNNEPLFDFTAPDGIQHTVWRITDTQALTESLSAVPRFYIADGHHRAASAWRAGQQKRGSLPESARDAAECNWFLTVLFPSDQLQILPYNRIISGLNGLTPSELLERLGQIGQMLPTENASPQSPGEFCLYIDRKWWLLKVPVPEEVATDPTVSLDVSILEHLVLSPILGIQDVRTDPRIDFVGGIRGTAELEKLCQSGAWDLAISMYRTSITQLMAVSDAGQIMPPKSTWFEPKLRSGLLIHKLTDQPAPN